MLSTEGRRGSRVGTTLHVPLSAPATCVYVRAQDFFWKQGKMKHLFWGCAHLRSNVSVPAVQHEDSPGKAAGASQARSRRKQSRRVGTIEDHGMDCRLLCQEKIVLFLKFRSECCQCRCTDDCCCCCCKWYSDYSISFIILFPRSVSLKVSSHLKLIDAQFLVSKAILLVYKRYVCHGDSFVVDLNT